MSNKTFASPVYMGRKDREKDDDWIQQLLLRAPFCVLAAVSEREPLVNIDLSVCDEAEHAIDLHTAPVGRMLANI